MPRFIIVLPFLALFILNCSAQELVAPANEARLVTESLRSTVQLQILKDHRISRPGAGFLIARPSDSRILVVTSGHNYRSDAAFSAELSGENKSIPCQPIALDESRDLLVLRPQIPIRRPALSFLQPDDPDPKLNDRVLLIGCPANLPLIHQWGNVHGAPITADKLAERLDGGRSAMTVRGSTVLIRHGAASAHGMSGGPLVDMHGRVVGIQAGGVPGTENLSFSVHAKHIAELNLDSEPSSFKPSPPPRPGFNQGLNGQRDDGEPVRLRIGGHEVDGRCYHFGYVPRQAQAVIDQFIDDKARFLKSLTKPLVQKILDDKEFAHITNPTLGFRVLVPKGYGYTVKPTQSLTGVVLDVIGDNQTIDLDRRLVRIIAMADESGYKNFASIADKEIKLGKYSKEFPDPPYPEAITRQTVIQSKQNIKRFYDTISLLNISFIDEGELVTGSPGKPGQAKPSFVLRDSEYSASLTTGWSNYEFDSIGDDWGYSIHIANRGSLSIVAYYRYLKQDRLGFLERRNFGRNYLDMRFIASTLSTY